MKLSLNQKKYKEVANEVEMMKRITHPNIIQLYDSFIDRQFDSSKLEKELNNKQRDQRGSHMQFQDSTFNQSVSSGSPVSPLLTQKTQPTGLSLYIAMEFAEMGDMQNLISD